MFLEKQICIFMKDHMTLKTAVMIILKYIFDQINAAMVREDFFWKH